MPRNLKIGGAISCLHVSTENIGKDKKRSSRLPTSNLPPKIKWRPKKKSMCAQMTCFHCFAYCRYISAYILVGGGRDPPGYAAVIILMLLSSQTLWPTENKVVAHYWAVAHRLKTSRLVRMTNFCLFLIIPSTMLAC